MEGRTQEDAMQAGGRLLLLVFLFVFLFIVIFFDKVAVLGGFTFALFVFLFIIQIIGNDVEVYRVRLGDFELGLALGAAQNLALFHFVFVNIDFGRAFRATNHGSILRKFVHLAEPLPHGLAMKRIIYRGD
jgi:hypothetical protein